MKALHELAFESIEVDPLMGFIKASEIQRICLEYGILLDGDYNFVATREFRILPIACLRSLS